jgi:hypothetical protein
VIVGGVVSGDLFRDDGGDIWEVEFVVAAPTAVLKRLTERHRSVSADREYVTVGQECQWLTGGPWR